MNKFNPFASFKPFTLLVASTLLALSACGSGGVPTPTDLSGTWNDTVKNPYGIVRMQYRFVQQGEQLSGQVYASKDKELLKVGTISGTLTSSGSAQIEGVFNENGASGSSKLSGTFSGTLRTYKSDGSPNQTVS